MNEDLPISFSDSDILGDAIGDAQRENPDVITYGDKASDIFGILCELTDREIQGKTPQEIEQMREKMLAKILVVKREHISAIIADDIPEITGLRERIDCTFAYARGFFRDCSGNRALMRRRLNDQNPYLRNRTPLQAFRAGDARLVLYAALIQRNS